MQVLSVLRDIVSFTTRYVMNNTMRREATAGGFPPSENSG